MIISQPYHAAGSETELKFSDFSDHTGDEVACESDLSVTDEDAESETVLSAVHVVQPSPSADLTGHIDLRISVTDGCEESHSLKNGPSGSEDDTTVKSRDSDTQDSEGAAASSDTSVWSVTESESDLSSESDSDSDSDGSCSCGDGAHSCSGDGETDESDSDSSETESESDSSSDGSQETGSDSDHDSHSSCGEDTCSSDCNERDETDPNDRMTDSDSD